MKIAIVSDDGQTISRHFGRAENYIVVSYEQEKIIDRNDCQPRGETALDI